MEMLDNALEGVSQAIRTNAIHTGILDQHRRPRSNSNTRSFFIDHGDSSDGSDIPGSTLVQRERAQLQTCDGGTRPDRQHSHGDRHH